MSNRCTDEMKQDITYMCYKKCIEAIEAPTLTAAERVCFSRCTFKFFDTLEFGNKVIDMVENKIGNENKQIEAKNL